MESRMRSGEHSGIVVKNRAQSGCLIVRKKGDGSGMADSMATRKIYNSKKEKKRSRMIMSDSGSSDELVMPPRRRVGPETIQVCNEFTIYQENEIGRKRNREERIRRSEEGLIGKDGEDLSESKRNRLDVFDFNEYDGLDKDIILRRNPAGYGGEEVGGRRLLGSLPAAARRSIEREYESGPSRKVFIEKKKKKKNLYFDKSDGMCWGDHDDNMFMKDRGGGRRHFSSMRESYMADSDEPIRVQGKNGVLKVMVNQKKMGKPLKNFGHLEVDVPRSGSRIDDTVRRNLHAHPSLCLETEVLEKPVSLGRKDKKKINLPKTPRTKKNKVSDWDSEDSDTSPKLSPKNMEASYSTKRVSSKEGKAQVELLLPTKSREGKIRRGCGTEKQKLRERIREMLQDAGWTIDYRPRRNRDYLDAVYINPAGTAYWSIIKAYDALLKQLDEEDEGKPGGDGSAFTPLSDEVLSQLTRKTRKKMEREMIKNQRDYSDSDNAQEAVARKSSSIRHEDESMDSLSQEKLCSFIKQGKSVNGKMNENGAFIGKCKGQSSLHVHESYEKPSSISNSNIVHGRKSRKLGRCTLLVRGSNAGLNSETDGFVPYSGKRTLLSWLIDSGAVQLSQKVQYMNRRRTKVILEGWITRDGIHCGCCSKILTVSKFEIHAGSKLRQPFQNIYLESGVSLLHCQIDAWNRQEESEQIGFRSVDIDGNDPNDDTCGICGDGGDLICCDSCPSTFHQSCLKIEFLPPGDWQCPNCICKFCGDGNDIAQEDGVTDFELLTCSLCEKKYHKSCVKVTDEVPFESNSLVLPFCGQKCGELFEHLQKYLGVKHELEAGFSWSLVRRTNAESDTSTRGLPQRVECNSKLAVALTVMDECFLPIVDRRSGIKLLNNVLYNCGSNFNRLSYSGFYTAILERGDEIISAASIRFHGTQLAEMPFIGTRHIYRRQGMCRRLFCAIQSALCSLKVEKLVIPAIAELTHTWTEVFGFTPLEESLKQEMRSMNMLVFPGIDMLQKLLLLQENTKTTLTALKGVTESGSYQSSKPEVANESKPCSSSWHDPPVCDDGGLHHTSRINDEIASADSDSQGPNVSVNDTCGTSGSLNASEEPNISVSVEETKLTNDQKGEKSNVSTSDSRCDVKPSSSHDAMEVENKPEADSPANKTEYCKEGMDDTCAVGVVDSNVPGADNGNVLTLSHSGDKAAESASNSKNPDTSSMDDSAVDTENKTASHSPTNKTIQSCGEGDLDAGHAIENFASSELTVEENISTVSQSQDKQAESPVDKSHVVSDANHNPLKMETKIISDSANVAVSVKVELDSASPEKSIIISGTSTNPDVLGMENKLGLGFPSCDSSGSAEERDVCDDQSRVTNGSNSPHLYP